MDVSIVVIGIDKWEEYTHPLLYTIEKSEPDASVILVDNASVIPYENAVRTDKRLSYAAALNFGASQADPDWYMFLNNDVYFQKPFLHRFDALDPRHFHGMNTYKFKNYDYICGWCMMISRELWNIVGPFDENLKPMWFEDADYSIRCQKEGFSLQIHDRYEWGVIHIEDENMADRRSYLQKNKPARRANREYVMRKHGL